MDTNESWSQPHIESHLMFNPNLLENNIQNILTARLLAPWFSRLNLTL